MGENSGSPGPYVEFALSVILFQAFFSNGYATSLVGHLLIVSSFFNLCVIFSAQLTPKRVYFS